MYALEGIKVLDLSQMWAVPGAGMYLADQGADVIKVEPPWGDEGRRVLTANPIRGANGTVSRHFLPINRNKRGIAVDIRTDPGKKIVYELAAKSDVFLHNFLPNSCTKLGLDYETLHNINPRLIYLSFSPFGLRGPYVNKPAYDRVVQSLSGVHGRRHLPDGTPLAAGVWVADCSTPILIAYGIALALLMREKTGLGQKVEASLLGGAIAMQSVELVRAQDERSSPPRSFADQAMYSPYACQDGKYILIAVVADKEWASLCRVLGIEHLVSDPGFINHEARAENSEVMFPILAGIFSTRPRDEWLGLLEEAEVACAPILEPAEVFSHPQVLQNNFIVEVDDPRVGKVKMMGIPLTLSQAPGAIRRQAPDLGQHTDEVLLELGYTREKIQDLRRRSVIL